MPTHNRSELLARAIKSVITQSYSNIELIICDDGSTDNTYDVVKNLSLKQI
ncbi:glycosyltransferase [Escherichia coli]|nr:glycosyltransferase [Escherichia coli]MDM4727972.1 glycosyltransferase [Escherichia coli]